MSDGKFERAVATGKEMLHRPSIILGLSAAAIFGAILMVLNIQAVYNFVRDHGAAIVAFGHSPWFGWFLWLTVVALIWRGIHLTIQAEDRATSERMIRSQELIAPVNEAIAQGQALTRLIAQEWLVRQHIQTECALLSAAADKAEKYGELINGIEAGEHGEIAKHITRPLSRMRGEVTNAFTQAHPIILGCAWPDAFEGAPDPHFTSNNETVQRVFEPAKNGLFLEAHKNIAQALKATAQTYSDKIQEEHRLASEIRNQISNEARRLTGS